MIKKFFAFALALVLALPAVANEGMWLPLLLGRNYEDMKANGLQLTPEQLYSINNSSIKDAIVSLGGFCTAEVISKNGLLLTNHHCGFDAIQTHSTPDNNLLDDGFWAKSYTEELPNEGLFVRFLVRMEDVSERVNAALSDTMSEATREAKIREIGKEIADEASKDNGYDANVKSFYHGNEFYLFVYETYRDVRLVGAPPSSVGKFGGDTDNWMWPRHTGDFSMFRVYTSPDGKPAEYSADNIPMKPKHHLPISMEGVKEGDFTMIFGYPGSTDRYLSSYGVKQAVELYNPSVVEVRDLKLEIMKKYMDADEATRIQYASKYARVSNYWKYFIGQTEQLKQNKVAAKKMVIEDDFRKWVSANPDRKEKYGNTLTLLEEAYKQSDSYVKSNVYVLEAGLTGSDLALFAFRFNRLMDNAFMLKEKMGEEMDAANTDEEKKAVKDKFQPKIDALMESVSASVEEHFKDYNKELDKELFANLFDLYAANIAANQQPEFFSMVNKKYKGDWNKFADKVYSKSILTSKESVLEFLQDPDQKKLKKDMGSVIGNELFEMYRSSAMSHADVDAKMEKGYRLFTAGVREMNSDKNYYPDANSTMRMTYGTVGSYYPRDGVFYNYYTTAEGILQKEDPNDMEFYMQDDLIEVIKKKDYGPYANKDGELPVCFISNNDITGGNSGSPVINGRGELIGCAFDGNWEAMSGDIFFEKQLQRTISVDIRYVLFIVDKYAGAKNIINELTFAERKDTPTESTLPAMDEKTTTSQKKK
jgi:hypothetical protein